MYSFTVYSVLAATFTSLVGAVAQSVGEPSGNPIYKPGLSEIVPCGTPYDITWSPTTQGTISLILLRGPSSNVVPIDNIASKIPNSGKYSWTPSCSLEPDTTHYGIKLVVDATGQYQYSTQFGISNPNSKGTTYASSSTATATAASIYGSSIKETATGTAKTTSMVHTTTSAKVNTTTTCTTSTTKETTSAKSTTYMTKPIYNNHTTTGFATTTKLAPTYKPTANSTTSVPPKATGNSAAGQFPNVKTAVLSVLFVAIASFVLL